MKLLYSIQSSRWWSWYKRVSVGALKIRKRNRVREKNGRIGKERERRTQRNILHAN